jgi:hypothetical protein
LEAAAEVAAIALPQAIVTILLTYTVALGRLGGKKRAATLSAEDLSAQGKRAAAARWAKARPAEPVNAGGESPISTRPEPVVEAAPDAESVAIRSHDVSAR